MEILKNVAFDIMTKENADNIIVQRYRYYGRNATGNLHSKLPYFVS